MPKLSIICPAYNHEKYVDDFIKSFLKQTENDIELIIVDDCSTDNTRNIIKSYDDNRITLIENQYNMGINSTIKNGILQSNSEVFAICASDDMLYPEYAETVINVFSKNPNIHLFFTALQEIDINGEIRNKIRTIKFNNKDRFFILEKLFLDNFIPAPGSAFRKESVLKVTSIPAGMFQYQDYHFHVQMLLHFDFYFNNKPLVYYRISNNSVSINSSLATAMRSTIEKNHLLDLYYYIDNVDVLKAIFKDNPVFQKYGEPVKETIPFFVCLIAIESYDHQHAMWGYNSLVKFYNEKNNQQLLYDLYKFQFKDYISEAKFLPDINSGINKKIKKLRKKRNIAVAAAVISVIINIILLLI